MSREWTVVIRGDWHLPHLVNMLKGYCGNGEQNECRDEVIGQINAQMIDDGAVYKTTRPLVVIDPEGYEWLPNRLRIHGAEMKGETGRMLSALADEIEHQMVPPKPDEPTVSGSRVREADGTIWTRVEGQPDKPWVYGGSDAAYSALDVVEVLQ